jgi:hypothetical protein
MSLNIKLFIALFGAFALLSCEKADPVIPNEEELITTMIYTMTPASGGDAVTFVFRDLDGEGGNPPEVTTEALAINTTYNGVIQLLNELETPPFNISNEVEQEGDSHQLFYNLEGLIEATIGYEDEDINGNPIGLKTSVSTMNGSKGSLTIILRHEPQKPNNGSPTDAGGETDIEVTFEIRIE